ncbi:MAG: hypothetical protein ACM3QZ_01715 [Solirubrobacterales bacterium]
MIYVWSVVTTIFAVALAAAVLALPFILLRMKHSMQKTNELLQQLLDHHADSARHRID